MQQIYISKEITTFRFPCVSNEHDMTWGLPPKSASVKMFKSSSTVTSTTAALDISREKESLNKDNQYKHEKSRTI